MSQESDWLVYDPTKGAVKAMMMQSGVSREMPRYKCHKVVWALKIKEIHPGTGQGVPGCTLVPAEDGYGPFPVDEDYMHKHKPQEGGYYVVYKDGYASFSPAAAFEEGYGLIS